MVDQNVYGAYLAGRIPRCARERMWLAPELRSKFQASFVERRLHKRASLTPDRIAVAENGLGRVP